jgi:ABC-type Mn2+/Zn2+ transport system permease subunit
MHSLLDFLKFDFLLYALISTILLSVVCGLISPLLITRKNAFMGSAISHSTLLGLSIALALFSSESSFSIFGLTLLITLMCTFFLARSTYRQTIPSDSLIGIFYTTTMAFGIIIHSLFSKSKGDLLSFLFGNILLLNNEDLVITGLLFLIVLPIIIIPFSKWIYITFDEEGALTSGLNTKFYHYIFFVMLALLIVTSIKVAGTILIETFLLIPGFFALSISKNIKNTFILSVVFSLVFAIIGLFLANAYSLPSGATLALTQFLGLILSLGLKKLYTLIKR